MFVLPTTVVVRWWQVRLAVYLEQASYDKIPRLVSYTKFWYLEIF